MNFKNREHKEFATESGILNCVTDKDIFNYYLGGIPKKLISSPIRDDKVPSFGLFHSDKYNRILYKDFATGESGNCFVFVKRLFNLSSINESYNRVASDFMLDQFQTFSPIPSNKIKKFVKSNQSKNSLEKNKITIKIKVRKWSKADKEYWFDKYGLNISLLKKCNVFPISHYFLNDYCVKAISISYAFLENKDGVQTFKIYQPFGENKWINNNNYSVWELWTQLPSKGKNLIITSSRKDAMVIKNLFDEKFITSCSLQGENFKPKDSVMEELVSRFENIYVLYDNDKNKSKNWGRIAGKKICGHYSKFGLKQIEISDEYDEKDISDFIEIHGKEKTLLLLNNML